MILFDLFRVFLFALPVAFVSWTISREELTRDARDFISVRISRWWIGAKFSHWLGCGFCQSPWWAFAICYWQDFRVFGDGSVSLMLTALAVGWVAWALQQAVARQL